MEIVLFIAGLLIGSIVMCFLMRQKTMGTLKLYDSDEPGGQPYMFVELDKPVEEVYKCRRVSFKISR